MSDLFKLNLKDFAKSLLLVVLTALIGGLYQLIQVGSTLDWTTIQPVVVASALAGISYLMKNFLTNSEDKILTPEK